MKMAGSSDFSLWRKVLRGTWFRTKVQMSQTTVVAAAELTGWLLGHFLYGGTWLCQWGPGCPGSGPPCTSYRNCVRWIRLRGTWQALTSLASRKAVTWCSLSISLRSGRGKHFPEVALRVSLPDDDESVVPASKTSKFAHTRQVQCHMDLGKGAV